MNGENRTARYLNATVDSQFVRDTADVSSAEARALAAILRLSLATCRFTVLGREHEAVALRSAGTVIYTTWHFAFPAVIYYFRNRNGMLMVSRSRDGEWVARVLRHLGYQTTRGSAGKGGGVALRHLIAHIKAGYPGGLIADGSQGPARVAQKGILILARHTQVPLVPVSMAASPCWRFNSWDRTVLPLPFSRIVLAFGPPIQVERNGPPERLEILRQELEDSLNCITRDAIGVLRLGR